MILYQNKYKMNKFKMDKFKMDIMKQIYLIKFTNNIKIIINN